MLNLSTLATELKVSSALLLEIEKTLESNAVEPTLGIVKSVYLDYIKGKKGVTGAKGAMAYLAHLAANHAREKSQPQMGLMQNLRTLEDQLVSQFDPATIALADRANARLVRNAVARTVASNLDEMPETRALLDQVGIFTSKVSADYRQDISPEDSMGMLLGSVVNYQAQGGNPSFLLSASTENLLSPSPDLTEEASETETAIA